MTEPIFSDATEQALERIADALERLAPPPATPPDFSKGQKAFVWNSAQSQLTEISQVNRLDIDLLIGIEQNRDVLLDNTRQFAKGLSANNALLWGARGMGKSSLIKAVHGKLLGEGYRLVLVEILREDLPSLGQLLKMLQKHRRRFLLFCDDLSFDYDDAHYKSLKTVLEGGLEGRAENILFYATSNRRHLLARDMIENEQSTALMPSEAVEEKLSLSDRFGLWLGFHACSQDEYLAMVQSYCRAFKLDIAPDRVRKQALEWQITRGARSGRVAWQFFVDLAGRHGLNIKGSAK